uniref:Endonuclease/exonuclease/phosphatase domain-containing protein n=1 Tax=Tetranychus urticae TaxID=32264 RepID=T1KGX5_TETUR
MSDASSCASRAVCCSKDKDMYAGPQEAIYLHKNWILNENFSRCDMSMQRFHTGTYSRHATRTGNGIGIIYCHRVTQEIPLFWFILRPILVRMIQGGLDCENNQRDTCHAVVIVGDFNADTTRIGAVRETQDI